MDTVYMFCIEWLCFHLICFIIVTINVNMYNHLCLDYLILSLSLSLSPPLSPPPPPPPLPLQVYTDWANNRLKKAGLTNVQVSDLQKDIPDGYILPKIIQAVGMCMAVHSLTHSLTHSFTHSLTHSFI